MAWQINGRYFAPCSCKVGCPCLLGETEADNGWCSGVLVLDIRSGQVDGMDVSGSKVGIVVDWPGGFLLGNGKGRLHFDPGVAADKRSTLGALVGGQLGGVFEAIGALVPDVEVGEDAAVDIRDQGDDMRLTIGNFVDLMITPLKGPGGEITQVLHGAAGFREETSLGRSAGTVRPQGFRSWQNERGHAEWSDFDWSA